MPNNRTEELMDHPDFVEIEVTQKENGIYVRLGRSGKIINETDAQFLCDALYEMLDDIHLTRSEVIDEGAKDAS